MVTSAAVFSGALVGQQPCEGVGSINSVSCVGERVSIQNLSIQRGTLYVVATPIGNLDDCSLRAVQTLSSVDFIAAEDTRHSRSLLTHYDIRVPLISLHEHNEAAVYPEILRRLEAGASAALISDAGTPLISDPGYVLVHAARAQDIRVVPVPGPSAVICALSVAGLPTDRFVFEGFLPRTPAARHARLQSLREEPRTLVFYEARHRIVDALRDLAASFGGDRRAVLAREMTKRFETIRADTLDVLVAWVDGDPQQTKGEFVLVVAGAESRAEATLDTKIEQVLRLLLEDLSVRRAAAVAAAITGEKKNRLYQEALRIKSSESRE